MRVIDLTGQKIGKLTVLKCIGSFPQGKRRFKKWLCQCDCGKTTEVRTGHLVKENGTRSCGCLNPWTPLEKGEASFNVVYDGYKRQAKNRNLLFGLTKEQFRVLVQKNCFYCDAPPNNISNRERHNGAFIYSGIDRINNKVGYIVANCVPCCKTCNYMKQDLSQSDFIEQVRKICSVTTAS